jgi:DNA mismatch endonuclease (patch repair protein)
VTEKISAEQRSRIMSRVRTRGTALELAVRKALFAAGFRYRLHPKNLPGRPDIVLPRYRNAIFVHGCFWPGHSCLRGRRPQSHAAFWSEKIDRNMARDQSVITAIELAGWTPKVIWQCDLETGVKELIRSLHRRDRLTKRASIAMRRYPVKKCAISFRGGGSSWPSKCGLRRQE